MYQKDLLMTSQGRGHAHMDAVLKLSQLVKSSSILYNTVTLEKEYDFTE